MTTPEFQKGDRVEHPTLGKGTFNSYGSSPVYSYPQAKSWVAFDDHKDGEYIGVTTYLLRPLSPGPKPEPYLEVRDTGVSLVGHYINHGMTWQPVEIKIWRRPMSKRIFVKLSEIEEALGDA